MRPDLHSRWLKTKRHLRSLRTDGFLGPTAIVDRVVGLNACENV